MGDKEIIRFAVKDNAVLPDEKNGIYQVYYPFYAKEKNLILQPGEKKIVPTGLHFNLAENYYLETKEKAGLAVVRQIVSAIPEGGLIDNDYTGELFVCLHNKNDRDYFVHPGDNIGQFIIKKQAEHQLKEIIIDDDKETTDMSDNKSKIDYHDNDDQQAQEMQALYELEQMHEEEEQQKQQEEEEEEEEGELDQEEMAAVDDLLDIIFADGVDDFEEEEEGEIKEEGAEAKTWNEEMEEKNKTAAAAAQEKETVSDCIKFAKIFEGAFEPKKSTPNSIGYDLKIPLSDVKGEPNSKKGIFIKAGETKKISLGIAFWQPEGWYGEIRNRSGLCVNDYIRVSVTLVPSNFHNSIAINVTNEGKTGFVFWPGDKCAQIVFHKIPTHKLIHEPCFLNLYDNKRSNRGPGGFGSTGG